MWSAPNTPALRPTRAANRAEPTNSGHGHRYFDAGARSSEILRLAPPCSAAAEPQLQPLVWPHS